MPNGNFDLESTLLEPWPRKFGNRIYLKVRSFRTALRANEAAVLIKENGGLARIVKYTGYGSEAYRVYANANGKKDAVRVISRISHLGKTWSDW